MLVNDSRGQKVKCNVNLCLSLAGMPGGLSQGYFIVGKNMHELKLSPAKQVLPARKASWDLAVSTIAPTRRESQVNFGKPWAGAFKIMQWVFISNIIVLLSKLSKAILYIILYRNQLKYFF